MAVAVAWWCRDVAPIFLAGGFLTEAFTAALSPKEVCTAEVEAQLLTLLPPVGEKDAMSIMSLGAKSALPCCLFSPSFAVED